LKVPFLAPILFFSITHLTFLDETKYGDGRNIQFVDIDYKIMAEQIVLLDVASMSSLQPQHLLGDVSLRDDASEILRVKKTSHNVLILSF